MMIPVFSLNSGCCVIATPGTLHSLYHLYRRVFLSQIFFIIAGIYDESFYVTVTKLDIFLYCPYCKSKMYFWLENLPEEFF